MQVRIALVNTHGITVVGASLVRQIDKVRFPIAVLQTTDTVLRDNEFLLDTVYGLDEHQISRSVPHAFADIIVKILRHPDTYLLLQLRHDLV